MNELSMLSVLVNSVSVNQTSAPTVINDEYLDEKGIEWLKANLTSLPKDVDALEFTLERKFMGGVIRHATNGIKMVRMFRTGRAKYAETLMETGT